MKKLTLISFNIFILLLLLASLNFLFINLNKYFFIILIFLIIYFFILLRYKSVVYKFLNRICNLIERVDIKLLFAILIFISILTKIFAAYFFEISLIREGTDTYVYVKSAVEIVKEGCVTTYANYSFDNPHLFFFSLILSPWIKIFGYSQNSLTWYMTLIMTINLVLIFDIFAFKEKISIGFISCLIYTLLPSSILMPQYITHEIPFFLLASISMWLYIKYYQPSNNIYFLILSILFLSLSILVNQMGYILIIAYFIYEFFILKKYKYFMKFIIVLIFVIVSIFYIGNISKDNLLINTNKHKQNSLQWVIYVGMNDETYGTWNLNDAIKWNDLNDSWTKEEIDVYHNKLFKDRFIYNLNNDKFPGLFLNKLSVDFGLFNYPISMANEYANNNYNFIYFYVLTLIGFLVNITLLFLVIFKINKKYDDLDYLFMLIILGISAVLLITEASNKYTYAIWLILICIELSRMINVCE